jgi:hypothetical protein
MFSCSSFSGRLPLRDRRQIGYFLLHLQWLQTATSGPFPRYGSCWVRQVGWRGCGRFLGQTGASWADNNSLYIHELLSDDSYENVADVNGTTDY